MIFVCLNNCQLKNFSQITHFEDTLFVFGTMQVGLTQWRIFPKLHIWKRMVFGAQRHRRRLWVTFSTEGETRFQSQINVNSGDFAWVLCRHSGRCWQCCGSCSLVKRWPPWYHLPRLRGYCSGTISNMAVF